MLTEKQFETAFREQYERLYYLSRDITGDHEAARDIVASCFSAVWTAHRNLPIEELPGYLYVSVRNESLQHVRQRQREAAVPIDLMGDIAMATVRDWREREEQIASAMRLLATLPDKARHMVELRFLQGLSYAEVADETGESVENVRKTLYRALKSLRKLINPKKGENLSTFFQLLIL